MISSKIEMISLKKKLIVDNRELTKGLRILFDAGGDLASYKNSCTIDRGSFVNCAAVN
jgi:hypothetical protein